MFAGIARCIARPSALVSGFKHDEPVGHQDEHEQREGGARPEPRSLLGAAALAPMRPCRSPNAAQVEQLAGAASERAPVQA